MLLEVLAYNGETLTIEKGEGNTVGSLTQKLISDNDPVTTDPQGEMVVILQGKIKTTIIRQLPHLFSKFIIVG